MRPLSWIVVGLSLAALVTGARLIVGRRPPPPVVAEILTTPAPPRRATTTPVFHAEARPQQLTPVPAHGLAHLHGRVLGPPAANDRELEVEASDGHRIYKADADDGGTFDLHLPARRYLVEARRGSMVAEGIIEARPGAREELTLTLRPGAAVAGRLHLPEGVAEKDVRVQISRAGSRAQREEPHAVTDGAFAVAGLVPGAVYDLVFDGTGLRPVRVSAVRAPADELDVTATAAPVLRGAIGLRPDGRCPLDEIEVRLEGSEESESYNVDRHCTFEVAGLGEARALTVSGSNDGWHVEEEVSIPAAGELPPICLNPPCRDLAPRGPAKIDVRLLDLPPDVMMQAFLDGYEDSGCAAPGPRPCTLEVARHDDIVTVVAHADGCETTRQTLQVHAGQNEVALPCRRTRLVQGTVHAADGAVARDAVIRCGPDGQSTRPQSYVFDLRCPADETEIIYQSGRRGGPHRARIPAGREPVLLDLTL